MVNRRAFAAAAAILALPVLARAQAIPEQSYPERTVRIIVPTAAGGSIDTTARVVARCSPATWTSGAARSRKRISASRREAEVPVQ